MFAGLAMVPTTHGWFHEGLKACSFHKRKQNTQLVEMGCFYPRLLTFFWSPDGTKAYKVVSLCQTVLNAIINCIYSSHKLYATPEACSVASTDRNWDGGVGNTGGGAF